VPAQLLEHAPQTAINAGGEHRLSLTGRHNNRKEIANRLISNLTESMIALKQLVADARRDGHPKERLTTTPT